MEKILTFQQFERESILESLLIPENSYDLSLFEALVEPKDDDLKNYWNGMLGVGNSGEYVKAVQKALGIESDGVFGGSTKEAVKKFQSENKITSDGVVGPITLKKIAGEAEAEVRKVLEEIIIRPKPSGLKGKPGLIQDKSVEKVEKVKAQLPKGAGTKKDADNRNYDKEVYKNVKHLKTVVIEGTKYVFVEIGDAIKNSVRAGQDETIKLAKYAGKTLVFIGETLYVTSRDFVKGLISLISGMVSWVEDGTIKMGQNVAEGAKAVYNWTKAKGGIIKDQLVDLGKVIMTQLFKLAKKCRDAKNAIASLMIASYKSATTFFKGAKDWTEQCIQNAAKIATINANELGKNVKEFYNNSVKTIEKAKSAVSATIKKGIATATDITKKGIQKAEQTVHKVEDVVKKSYKASIDTAKKFADDVVKDVNAIWYALTDSYHADGNSIFESYVIQGGEKFYI
jgi:peptidoglycan hydrolase-like protein with peptidoglycan-binding domain